MDKHIEKELKIILKAISDDDFFNPKKEHEVSLSNISTAVRVLLSEEYYDKFKENYNVTNALHQFIYRIYSKDDKDILRYLDDNDSFNQYFKENRPIKDLFWQSSFWHYDSKFGVLRKESIKKLAPKGRYYEKELINDPNTLDRKSYQNADKIHPTHLFNDVSEDNAEKYNWIYGKYDFTDVYFVRFYWNFYPDKIIITKFLKTLQTCFDNNKIPFQFKFLADIRDYKTHSDVGVLYLPRKHILICIELVRDIHKEFFKEVFFYETKPMFTKYLGKGLSFGENPDDSRYTSFGSYRAIHIAMSIIEFYFIKSKAKLPSIPKLLKLINYRNPNWTKQFHVNEFSINSYKEEFRFFEKTYNNNRILLINLPKDLAVNNDWLYENKASDKKKYLFTAVQIANILCKEAIWFEQSSPVDKKTISYPLNCNWISFKGILNSNSSPNSSIGYHFDALDETFIEGRLGVAYFLKQVHKAYRDETFYRTSYRTLEGAFKQLPKTLNNKYLSELNWIINKMRDNLTKRVKFFKNTENLVSKRGLIAPFEVEIKRNIGAWREEKFQSVIDKIISNDFFQLSNNELKVIDEMLTNYFDVERPFGNALGTDEFCATIKDGYACLGYFFLRLYDPITFKALPFKITYV
jgi:hypothetical protein